MKTAVEVSELTKAYENVIAVDGISFTINEGEITGLLGPNGAGKTTTLECMEGLRQPDHGHINILGVNPARGQLKSVLGVQLQTGGLPGTLTVKEAMKLFSSYHGVTPRFDLLSRFDLNDSVDVEYDALSTGQKRKLALALAIVHQPPVVLLDEPTAGLDVQSRVELHDIMKELKRNGVTIILSTHDMAEAEQMADRVLVMVRGKIIADGPPAELTAGSVQLARISVKTSERCLDGASLPAVERTAVRDGYDIYFSRDIGKTAVAIIKHIDQSEDTLIDLRIERPSLEERFLELTRAGEIQ